MIHDYNGALAAEAVFRIRDDYIPLFEEFKDKAKYYLEKMSRTTDSSHF